MRHFILKILMPIAFLAGITLHANAQSTDVTLIVTKTNGEEQTYRLTGESQLYFENGETLVIDEGNGILQTYPLAQIRKIECAEVTGTSDDTSSGLQLFPNPSRNSFTIMGLRDTHLAHIYAIDGRLVKSFEATEGMMIDISELAEGMYLLHINGQTLKLMKL